MLVVVESAGCTWKLNLIKNNSSNNCNNNVVIMSDRKKTHWGDEHEEEKWHLSSLDIRYRPLPYSKPTLPQARIKVILFNI